METILSYEQLEILSVHGLDFERFLSQNYWITNECQQDILELYIFLNNDCMLSINNFLEITIIL